MLQHPVMFVSTCESTVCLSLKISLLPPPPELSSHLFFGSPSLLHLRISPLGNSICGSLYYLCALVKPRLLHPLKPCLLLPSFLLISQKRLSHVTSEGAITPATISSSFYASFALKRNNYPHLMSEAEWSLTSDTAAVAETVF